MNTSTVSRSHNLHSHLSHIAPKVAPKANHTDADKKLHSDHARLSKEAEGLSKKEDEHKEAGKTADTSKSPEAKKPGEVKELSKTDIDERIAALEKELEELKKEFQANKDGGQKKAGAAGGGAKGGGAAKDKGPTVMNPDAPAGFLWKPESDSDGKLAILLPPSMSGKVRSVEVLSPDGQVLASGRGAGIGNGDREHFRFSQPGGSFPPNSKVRITMKDGAQQEITIPQTGIRNEGGGKK